MGIHRRRYIILTTTAIHTMATAILGTVIGLLSLSAITPTIITTIAILTRLAGSAMAIISAHFTAQLGSTAVLIASHPITADSGPRQDFVHP